MDVEPRGGPDAREKSPAVRQIHERIKQHLLAVTIGRTALAFDHEDFRVFYLDSRARRR